jgi:hypothetical protein
MFRTPTVGEGKSKKDENVHYYTKYYLVSPTIWNYTIVYIFIIDGISYQVKMLMLYNVQTTNLIFVDKYETCNKCIYIALHDSK